MKRFSLIAILVTGCTFGTAPLDVESTHDRSNTLGSATSTGAEPVLGELTLGDDTPVPSDSSHDMFEPKQLAAKASAEANVIPAIRCEVESKVLVEPAYESSNPLYAVAAFGPKARSQVWIVLDQSEPDSGDYDTVYVDLNANGDLTENGERHEWTREDGALTRRMELPDFTDPNSGITHTALRLSYLGRRAEYLVSLKWNGGLRMTAGYPENPENGYCRFVSKAGDAPVVWFNGDGPFQFQRWYTDNFTIGENNDIKLFLGLPGRGSSSFCTFATHVLEEGEPVLATLLYTDIEDKQKSVDFKLASRC